MSKVWRRQRGSKVQFATRAARRLRRKTQQAVSAGAQRARMILTHFSSLAFAYLNFALYTSLHTSRLIKAGQQRKSDSSPFLLPFPPQSPSSRRRHSTSYPYPRPRPLPSLLSICPPVCLICFLPEGETIFWMSPGADKLMPAATPPSVLLFSVADHFVPRRERE